MSCGEEEEAGLEGTSSSVADSRDSVVRPGMSARHTPVRELAMSSIDKLLIQGVSYEFNAVSVECSQCYLLVMVQKYTLPVRNGRGCQISGR